VPIVAIELPQVGETVVEGIIDRWLKRQGEQVKKYDPLVEVVTDKVNMEVPSPFSGVLTRIIAQEGSTVAMGSVIAEMETDEADQTSQEAVPPKEKALDFAVAGTAGILLESSAPVGPTGAGEPESQQPVEAVQSPPVRATTIHGRFYSPVVSSLAQDLGIDLEQVKGTGADGRVTKKDVQQYAESAAATAKVATGAASPTTGQAPGAVEEMVAVRPVRRLIAHHLALSTSEIPHAWAMVEVDVTGLVELRSALREEFKAREGLDLTSLPFVIMVVAQALKEHPHLNSTWRNDGLVLKKRVNIGVAVGAPDGLVVPVIHEADALSVAGINRRLRDLADRARTGKLTLEDVQDGTFTVNNTGALGTVLSGPIINHPQAGILTTEVIQKRPVVINDGIAIRSMMNICLAFDHRVLDGLEAGQFLQSMKRRLENVGPDTPVY